MRTFNNVNTNNFTCVADLEDFGDNTGMAACFKELGLDVPTDDSYITQEDTFSIDVLEIF